MREITIQLRVPLFFRIAILAALVLGCAFIYVALDQDAQAARIERELKNLVEVQAWASMEELQSREEAAETKRQALKRID